MNAPMPIPAAAGPSTLIRPNRCEKCKWASAVPQDRNLQCRRYPPQAAHIVNQRGMLQVVTYFPIVKPDEGCGEYQPLVAGMN
jgi:hypothetical protein